MANVGGILQALGGFFGGYGQDQQNTLQRERQAAVDAENTQMHQAQMANYASEAAQRTSTIDAQRIKALSNRRAFNALKGQFGAHPLAQDEYDDATDYAGALKDAQDQGRKRTESVGKARADYNTLRAYAPKDPLASQPFDDTNPADYSAALTHFRDVQKQQAAAAAAAGKEHWVSAGVNPQGQPVILNTETGETKIGGGNKALGPGGETPQVTATRRDLKGFQSQQIRAEHDVGAAKGDIRALLSAHPRASQPLPNQRTAADSAFANQFTAGQSAVKDAEARKQRLTTSADSTQNVLNQMRAGGVPAPSGVGGTGAPAPAVAPTDRIARQKQEEAGFREAAQEIDKIPDPAKRLTAKRQAMQIYNDRMQKLNAGIDPDGE